MMGTLYITGDGVTLHIDHKHLMGTLYIIS